MPTSDVLTLCPPTGNGSLALSYGTVYPLTPCCAASAKGSMAGDEPATVCRACYHEIDPMLGDCAVVSSPTFEADLNRLCRTVGTEGYEGILERVRAATTAEEPS